MRASESIVSLTDILSSLSAASLSTVSSTLRRDLTSHYIDHLLTQPASVETSVVKHLAGTSELRLAIFPSPPNTEDVASRIVNAHHVFAFLNENLFPHFPASAKLQASLSKPLTSALLEKLLLPSLPSSIADLPAFLSLMQQAVKLEEDVIDGILGGGRGEKDIAAWAAGIAGHYERKRRVELLEKARTIILREEDKSAIFRVDITPAISQQGVMPDPPVVPPEREPSPEEAAWGFDDDDGGSAPADEVSWGFDDHTVPRPVAAETAPAAGSTPLAEPSEDPGNAWGWNDEEESPGAGEEDTSTDSSAWDDPWGDMSDSSPTSSPVKKAPKTATKLEKLSKSGKTNGNAPAMASPVPVPPPPPTPAMPGSASQTPIAHQQSMVEKEWYLVSGRMKELMALTEDILREAGDLVSSGILAPFAADPSRIGAVITPTAASILDLYRALYPVHVESLWQTSAKWPIQFSNNCTWLSQNMRRIVGGRNIPHVAKSDLDACCEVLALEGEQWYDDTVVSP